MNLKDYFIPKHELIKNIFIKGKVGKLPLTKKLKNDFEIILDKCGYIITDYIGQIFRKNEPIDFEFDVEKIEGNEPYHITFGFDYDSYQFLSATVYNDDYEIEEEIP